jgi:CheY-like chemotaxis protein
MSQQPSQCVLLVGQIPCHPAWSGESVESVPGAVAALVRLTDVQAQRVDLVVVDAGLGGMGPIALVAAIRGMAISPRIIAWGGRVPGIETIDEDPVAVPDAVPSDQPTAAAAVPLVLVVEDNEINQQIVRRMLDMLGLRCVVASNGHEALDACAAGGVSLVLMDVQMPVMDGLEATRELRRREAGTPLHLPIVGLSAHALPEDRAVALAAGMDDYLTKPVVIESLGACIRRWLGGSSECIPSQPAVPSVQVLDAEVMGRLRQFGDVVFRELLCHLHHDLPLKRAAVAAALGAGDCDSLRRLGHALKGSAGSIGAMQLMEASAGLMDAATAGGDLASAMRAFERALMATEAALARELNPRTCDQPQDTRTPT